MPVQILIMIDPNLIVYNVSCLSELYYSLHENNIFVKTEQVLYVFC